MKVLGAMRRRSLLVAAAVAIMMLAAPAGAWAQLGIGQVNGTVFGEDRKGAPGLPVAVVPQDGRVLYATSTDSDGRYAVRGMAPGTYSVVVRFPSGVARKDGIRIRPLFRSIVDFTEGSDAAGASLPGLRAGAPADAAHQPAGAPGASGTLPAQGKTGRTGMPASPPAGTMPAAIDAPVTPAATTVNPHASAPSAPAPATAAPSAPAPESQAPATAAPSAPAAESQVPATMAPATTATQASAQAPGTPAPSASAPASAPATTDGPGIVMSWNLHGPDRSPAADAWVAVIPAREGALRQGRTDAEGAASLGDVRPGQYHLLVRAPGFMTWRLGPLPVDGEGRISISMTLVPYPMGFAGTLEDLLIPVEPVAPAPEPDAKPEQE